MKSKNIVTLIILISFVTLVGTLTAAPPPPPPGPTGCWPPPCTIPVDGGIGFLLAAGLAYGAKKLYGVRK